MYVHASYKRAFGGSCKLYSNKWAPCSWMILFYLTRIMVQLSRNLSLRKLWHHFIEISFSRIQLQDSLNRYWASAMTNNEVSQSPPVSSTQRISFDGKLTGKKISYFPPRPRSFSSVVCPWQQDQSD